MTMIQDRVVMQVGRSNMRAVGLWGLPRRSRYCFSHPCRRPRPSLIAWGLSYGASSTPTLG